MACTTMTIPTYPAATAATNDVLKEHNGLRRSQSGKDLGQRGVRGIHRSRSDNHLCYSINRIRATTIQPKLKNSQSVGIFKFHISNSMIPNSLKSLLFNPESMAEREVDVLENYDVGDEDEKGVKRTNWVERLLEIRGKWKNKQETEESIDCDEIHDEIHDEDENVDCDCDSECVVEYDSREEEEVVPEVYNQESFSKLLVQVPWSDTKQFSQLAFLCNMAYVIPEIKPEDLRRYYGLQFVTSSIEKKAKVAILVEKLEQDFTRVPDATVEDTAKKLGEMKHKRPIRSSVAHEIAASAASYVQSCAEDLLSPASESLQETDVTDGKRSVNQPKEESENSKRVHKSVVAAHAAASTMTAVVAAGEKEKQETARALQSLHSSPCEWFVCDDTSTYTRCFVIQGSDSLASWQANLFFEPTKFEGTEAIVHRGIYEAAKGIYEQFLPEIMDYMETHGERAKFQFTGHSLGGSLSLLVNLMLLTRNIVKPSALRPVVTFGSPFVFCGGQKILDDLGLDESHVQCVMMHRDIVPRAFSCNYPNHVALVLKRLNSSFRSHPCLIKNKVLYSPMGKLFILQPNENMSPSHPLLPEGNALYALDKTKSGYSPSALTAFLNRPHPLQTLSDPTAYGSEGSILRDHDSSNYLKAMNGVLRQHTKLVIRKVRKERNMLWPLLTSPSPHSWRHDRSFNSCSLTKEVMTGV